MFKANLPTDLYTAEACKALDRSAIEHLGVTGYQLMQRTAQSALALIRQCWPQARSLSIWVGAGNNGGDGVVLARLAYDLDWRVQLVIPDQNLAERLQGEAAQAWADLPHAIKPEVFEPGLCLQGELIVDAILGIGLKGDVRGTPAEMIDAINASDKPVFAMDLPSGLDADLGVPLGQAVKADVTLTFIANKLGWIINQGAEYAGRRYWAGLGLTPGFDPSIRPVAQMPDLHLLNRLVGRRKRDAHKGRFGVLLVLGGNLGMGGAAIMAAQAALRSGCGRVVLGTRSAHLSGALARVPEVMVHNLDNPESACSLLAQADALVVGPGLGKDGWAREILDLALQAAKPTLFDADALNLISELKLTPTGSCVFTPHPAEAARLLGETTSEIQADRVAALQRLVVKLDGVHVLKGAGSLIGASERLAVCDRGNPGMATAGMGDLLSGIIGALLAQGLEPFDAAQLGVWIHAVAGDKAARAGEVGLVATDLLAELRWVMNLGLDAELSEIYE